ncbi:hypothetical protein [Roseibium aggregatum]|uniref:PepSY-like beta-lactamase-inhibitor n=1 Tax=Roseibium aggregatum TaxID=187304 RepID=A0A939J2L0_9HYPH|nr:hypothetical protein [Roseibium aggregatum]MBN9671533.1 hypothetical protein [Roseibium aggregatum]
MKQTLLSLFLLTVPAGAVFAQPLPEPVEHLVQEIGLQEVSWHPGRKQPDLEGRLPGGIRVEIDFHHGFELEEIEADHHGLFKVDLIEAVLPSHFKDSPDYPHGALISKIELKDDEIEIEGKTADGQWFEAEYDRSGSLRKWERD